MLIVVNSHSSPSTHWDRRESPPGFVAQLMQSAGVPIDRYSFVPIETMKDIAEIWKRRRELLVDRARPADTTKAQAQAAYPESAWMCWPLASMPSPTARNEYFLNLPKSFALPDEAVDRLRDVAGRLLRQSAEYERVLGDLGGRPAE